MLFYRLYKRIKRMLSTLSALALTVALGWGIYAFNACKLRAIDGERVFYLNSNSSQGLRKEELSPLDFTRITGEVVRSKLGEKSGEEAANEIMERYGAQVLFVEEVGGVKSYYCYTPQWEDTLALNGQTVNLHVAVSNEECVVGTPIIFDGF